MTSEQVRALVSYSVRRLGCLTAGQRAHIRGHAMRATVEATEPLEVVYGHVDVVASYVADGAQFGHDNTSNLPDEDRRIFNEHLEALVAAEVEMRICRECGCTAERGCPEGCFWVDDDMCSECAQGQDAVDALRFALDGAPALVVGDVTQGDALGCDGAALQAAGPMGVDHD